MRQKTAQVVLCSLGVLLLVWACIDPRFRGADGFLRAIVCLPLSTGIALVIAGLAATSRLRWTALWFGLVLVGQAVALQLINAGPLIHWQHYWPLDRLAAQTNPLLLLFVVGQTALVLAALRRRWPRLRAFLSSVPLWRVMAVVLVFVVSAAAVKRDILFYAGDLATAVFFQALSLGTVLSAVLSLPEDALARLKQRWDSVFSNDQAEGRPAGSDRLALAGAVWVAVVASALNLWSYQAHPHITDEVVYLYHARFLAAGALTLPAPPVPEGFELYLMEVKGDQWYAVTPPGWPAVLAMGVRFGVPWLVNPLLAALNVLLVYALMRDLYDRASARLAVCLLCVSPWYVFMAMNFMTHMVTLTCVLIAAVAVILARKTGRVRWGFVAGCALGAGTLVRPLDGLIAAGLVGLWAMGIGGRRLRVQALVALGVGAALVGALVMPYNDALTGNALTFPLNAYLDSHFGPGLNDLGFGPNRGYGWPIQPFAGHSPLGAMINANLNTFSINIELFGWGIGSLLLAAITVFWGRLRRGDYLMMAVCLAVFVPYFFYYFSGGPDFGARYWFLMLAPLVALTVRAVEVLREKAQSAGSTTLGARVMAAVIVLSLAAVINYFPWRAIDKYHNYWGMRPGVVALAQQYGFGKSLVLVRAAESHPAYASAAIYNPLSWQADAPIYAWDRDPQVRAQLLLAFPDRQVWIVDAPTVAHDAYRVVEGPLSPQAASEGR